MDTVAILREARTLSEHAIRLRAKARVIRAGAQYSRALVRGLNRLHSARLLGHLARGGSGDGDGEVPAVSTEDLRCPFCKSPRTITQTGQTEVAQAYAVAVFRCDTCHLPFVYLGGAESDGAGSDNGSSWEAFPPTA